MLQLPLADFVWFQNVVIPVLGMGMGAFVLFGAYRTVNRYLDRRHEQQLAAAAGGHSGPDLEDLRSRVELLEDSVDRVQELEERLDFTERMLAQQQRQQLDPGRGG
jgi:flagellar biosynthesis/type III secretory pathway M-ring protein FliF/YscJ